MSTLQKLKGTPLTPEQLQHMYNKATGKNLKVIIMDDVKSNETLDELFNNNQCFVLFVPVMSQYNGHFISFFKKNGIYMLDSYGHTPKQLVNSIEQLGQVNLNLNVFKILQGSNLPFYFSPVLYQSMNDKIADCGRYAVLNCILFTKYRQMGKYYDLKVFNSFLINYLKKHNIRDYDDAVTLITKAI